MAVSDPLLEVTDLVKHFPVRTGLFGRKLFVHAVDGVSFQVEPKTTFGIVVESGCGKTTVSRLILQLETPTSGQIFYRGQDVDKLSSSGLREYRRSAQAVFQDPYSSLDPRMRVEHIVGEPLISLMSEANRREKQRMVDEALELVGLSVGSKRFYPHEFSGGQRQRIAVARAIVGRPEFLVLDEAVSALDVSVRAQVLNLFQDLQDELGLTYILIAHDLAVIEHISDKVAVMYLGKLMETIPASELSTNALHPYTRVLLAAVPRPDPSQPLDTDLILAGEVPSPINVPSGCRFRTRCAFAFDRCAVEEPPLRKSDENHWVACHLYDAQTTPA